MRFFYALLFWATVSGDEEDRIPCHPNDNVLLPCNCAGMNRTKGFRWQITTKRSFCFLNQSSKPNKNCTRRIITFEHDTIDNCSILLEKITETDNGTYICIFQQPLYTRHIVHLVVSSASPKTDTTFVRDSVKDTKMSLTIIIIPALLLFGCILIVLLKRRQKIKELVNQVNPLP